MDTQNYRFRWRWYSTLSGRRPVRDFIDSLSAEDRLAVIKKMKGVAKIGLTSTRHLQDEIYEVRVAGQFANYRLLFAPEGKRNHVFLLLVAFSKKTQRTPPQEIYLAQIRLKDWRKRGIRSKKNSQGE